MEKDEGGEGEEVGERREELYEQSALRGPDSLGALSPWHGVWGKEGVREQQSAQRAAARAECGGKETTWEADIKSRGMGQAQDFSHPLTLTSGPRCLIQAAEPIVTPHPYGHSLPPTHVPSMPNS